MRPRSGPGTMAMIVTGEDGSIVTTLASERQRSATRSSWRTSSTGHASHSLITNWYGVEVATASPPGTYVGPHRSARKTPPRDFAHRAMSHCAAASDGMRMISLPLATESGKLIGRSSMTSCGLKPVGRPVEVGVVERSVRGIVGYLSNLPPADPGGLFVVELASRASINGRPLSSRAAQNGGAGRGGGFPAGQHTPEDAHL